MIVRVCVAVAAGMVGQVPLPRGFSRRIAVSCPRGPSCRSSPRGTSVGTGAVTITTQHVDGNFSRAHEAQNFYYCFGGQAETMNNLC